MGADAEPDVFDLDCSDLLEVHRRVVTPVVASLIRPDELESCTLRFGPPPGWRPAFDDDDPEVWLILSAGGETFEWRVCTATRVLWSAEDTAMTLCDALEDWLPETGFAWGEQRGGDYMVPGRAETSR